MVATVWKIDICTVYPIEYIPIKYVLNLSMSLELVYTAQLNGRTNVFILLQWFIGVDRIFCTMQIKPFAIIFYTMGLAFYASILFSGCI